MELTLDRERDGARFHFRVLAGWTVQLVWRHSSWPPYGFRWRVNERAGFSSPTASGIAPRPYYVKKSTGSVSAEPIL